MKRNDVMVLTIKVAVRSERIKLAEAAARMAIQFLEETGHVLREIRGGFSCAPQRPHFRLHGSDPA